MAGLQTTYNLGSSSARADFHRPDFEKIIREKGRNVIVEKGLLCPCKSKAGGQQSNCQNCGGTGWLFVNPRETRLVIQSMKITPNYKAWSEEISGDLQVTASDNEELSLMDRITLNCSISIFNEVLFFRQKGDVVFAFTAYNIKEVLYVGYFNGTNKPLKRLVYGTDYTFDRNIIKLINPDLIEVQNEISVTIRYKHYPQYLMIDMKRESMESFELVGTDKLIHLPIAGTARKCHYILDSYKLEGNRILSNSYEVEKSVGCNCYTSQQTVTLPQSSINGALVIPFVQQTSITINHNLGRYVQVQIYDDNDLIMTNNVGVTVERVDNNNVRISFPQSSSGTIIIT